MGRGLALRWALTHSVCLGSRSLEKASSVAREYHAIARGFYCNALKGEVIGCTNNDAASYSDVVVLTIPPQHTLETVRQIKPSLKQDQVIVSTVVPMVREGRLFTYMPLPSDEGSTSDRSAAERIAAEVYPIPVVSAFQTVPASYLADLDSILNIDVLISGDDERALETASRLVRDIPNLRPLRVGPLSNSKFVESITPLLMNTAILNKLKDPSIRIVPWLPSDIQKEE